MGWIDMAGTRLSGALRTALVLALLCFAALISSGCGDDGGGSQGSAEATGDKQSTAREGESTAAGTTSGSTTLEGNAGEQPEATTGSTTETTTEESTTSSESGNSDDSGSGRPSTLFSGVEDPTEGLLTDHRMVSYYGHPFSPAMGELGQYESPQAMVEALKKQAEAYTRADPDLPAVPTIELIASVAQPTPGPDGDYLNRTPPEVIEEYVEVARENDTELLLDVQIGYSTVAEEIEAIRPYLELPFVHLAIDPEYDMASGEVPAQQVGSTPASEVNQAARTLSEIVETEDLPPKVMVVHQFQAGMITNKQALTTTRNVQTVIHADGFGYPETKFSKYRAMIENEPVQYGGFKLFYDQDISLLSPEQVLSELDPPPAVVSYQ